MSAPLKGRISGLHWRTRHRIGNRYMDARAVLAGFCNDNPFRPTPGEGGYSFWRCCRKAGHDGRHRFRNYVWETGGRPDHVPEDWPTAVDGGYVDQPRNRYPTLTLRQSRAVDAWHRARAAQRTGA